MIKPLNWLLLAAACCPMLVSAQSLIGPELSTFSALAGGYATYGADAVISGNVGAVTYVVGGLNSSSGGDYTNTPNVTAALTQIGDAQAALTAMGAGTVLAPGMGGAQTLTEGVYSASALVTVAGTVLTLDGAGALAPIWVFNIDTHLVTGAGTEIKIINAGSGATVVWNVGSYASLGADTKFIGTMLATGYISEGAGSNFTCGNAFSKSYISMPAGGTVVSTNCAGSGTWAGSVSGMGSGLNIVNGVAVDATPGDGTGGTSGTGGTGSGGTVAGTADPANTVPEPQTPGLVLVALLTLALATWRFKKHRANTPA